MNNKKEGKSNNKKLRKPLTVILPLIAAFVVINLAPYVYDAVRNDPNILLKRLSKDLTEDSAVDIKYTQRSGRPMLLGGSGGRLYSFTPEKSGVYEFSVSDIVSEEDVYLSLQVSDSHFNNYLSTDNTEAGTDSFSDTVFLNEGSICYVLIEPFSEDDREKFSGSFRLSVSAADEESRPAEITEEEAATIRVVEDSQTAVLFVPEESGYFRFESMIVSKDRTALSAISSVKTTDNEEIKRAEGICYLEGGREYYVWVSAQDLSKKSVKAEVSCSRMEILAADQPGEYIINGDTVIVYTSRITKNMLVYSVSDGDVRGAVYDSKGFPLNFDDNSGEDMSGNRKDFALVIQAQKRSRYLIYAEGRFNECSIVIAEYDG